MVHSRCRSGTPKASTVFGSGTGRRRILYARWRRVGAVGSHTTSAQAPRFVARALIGLMAHAGDRFASQRQIPCWLAHDREKSSFAKFGKTCVSTPFLLWFPSRQFGRFPATRPT